MARASPLFVSPSSSFPSSDFPDQHHEWDRYDAWGAYATDAAAAASNFARGNYGRVGALPEWGRGILPGAVGYEDNAF